MKRNKTPIILAILIAIVALVASQVMWLNYATRQESYQQKNNFENYFNESIATLIKLRWNSDKWDAPYEIEPIEKLDDGKYNITEEQEMQVVNAGDNPDKKISDMLEDAFIVISIKENKFRTQQLDSILTSFLNKNSCVISSHIVLLDAKTNVKLDEAKNEYNTSATKLFAKSYTAKRKVEIPDHTYIISAKYTIAPSIYLQRMTWLMIVSLLSSLVILSVMSFLLKSINEREQKANSMERSFHGAIHDLKSPLAYVFFLLSSLEEEETDIDKKASLSLSANRVSFLTDKIKRLLTSARDIQNIEKKDKTDVPLYDILEQIETEMHTMFPNKKICINNNVDADLTMRVLPDLMEAAIRIIIENAVKYNGNNPVVAIDAVSDEANLKIYISDNGEGMSKQQMKHIFKPYYSSDKIEGNGIGLYYAQSIVKAHGGAISVNSEPGKGSTFVISLSNL